VKNLKVGTVFYEPKYFSGFWSENYLFELVFWPKINNPIYSCTLGLVRIVIRSILNIQMLDNVAENTRK